MLLDALKKSSGKCRINETSTHRSAEGFGHEGHDCRFLVVSSMDHGVVIRPMIYIKFRAFGDQTTQPQRMLDRHSAASAMIASILSYWLCN